MRLSISLNLLDDEFSATKTFSLHIPLISLDAICSRRLLLFFIAALIISLCFVCYFLIDSTASVTLTNFPVSGLCMHDTHAICSSFLSLREKWHSGNSEIPATTNKVNNMHIQSHTHTHIKSLNIVLMVAEKTPSFLSTAEDLQLSYEEEA